MQLRNFLLPLAVVASQAAAIALTEAFTYVTTTSTQLGNAIQIGSSASEILNSGREFIVALDGVTAAVEEESPLNLGQAVTTVTQFTLSATSIADTTRVAAERREDMEELGIREEVGAVFADVFIRFQELGDTTAAGVPAPIRPQVRAVVDSLQVAITGFRAAFE